MWDRVDRNKPLLYCALGSHNQAYTHSQQFYQTIITTLAKRPDWQAIIAIGNHLCIEDFHSVPPNVILTNWAPQLEILQNSSLMITHAGLGTVKECIYRGVPMIAFPVTGDHPGNAARIVYHRLGVMGNFRNVSVQQVLSMIENLEKDVSFKKRVEAMMNKLKDMEDSRTGLQMIRTLLTSVQQKEENL